ncbi:L-fuculose 1-phosphate aldolase [Sphaerotilus hippei]|uniref:L-fuculose 1-phosphate aldolase n=1 Tax=Sphaerotilus hippei TaxID=744406 RepID=A0A318H110_9BURK|nr:class II aldolase/adducin family protein [Sphaerotilus hippei]PXW96554.1 L-fuculose 1-phosphate aldolase [Sphaerotilus hippei]
MTTTHDPADASTHRAALVAHALSLSPSGLSQGTSGNLSVRWREAGCEGMLITPSGVDYRRLQPGDIVFVQLHDGAWQGPLKPSSEWRFHRDIYLARPEVGAVVHAHPTHTTALAVQRRGIPAFHYMVAVAGGRDIRCAPYATYGTETLSRHALAALADRRACLLANHGMIAVGADLGSAFALAIEVEQLAHQYLLALGTGGPVLLPDDEMDRVLDAFRSYGANAQSAAAQEPA